MKTLALAIDIAIVAFLILQTWLGWRRGLLWQVVGVASIAFGILLARLLAPSLGEYLTQSIASDHFHARLVAFLFVAGSVGLALRMLAAWAEVRSESGVPAEVRASRRKDDRVLGGIFGAVRAAVLALVVCASAVSIYPRSGVWENSNLARPLASAGARLLPDGAVDAMKCWAVQSATDLGQRLDIR